MKKRSLSGTACALYAQALSARNGERKVADDRIAVGEREREVPYFYFILETDQLYIPGVTKLKENQKNLPFLSL